MIILEPCWWLHANHVFLLTRCFVMNNAGLVMFDRIWPDTGERVDHVMNVHPDIGQDLQQQGYATFDYCTKYNTNSKIDVNPQLYKSWKVRKLKDAKLMSSGDV